MPPKAKKGVPAAPLPPKGLTVNGCLFMPSTRALCSFLDLNNVKFVLNDLNIF
jgi:hypothetical protein